MTLILAATVGHHVFHASDRLITVPGRVKNRSQAWDIASNKTVIVVASDCWLVIGYTGLAYLDGIPTDQFIAQAISGQKNLAGSGISAWGLPADRMHYRAITSRLSAAIENAYTRLPSHVRRYPTTVLGAGLQQAAPRLRQIMFETVHSESGTTHTELAKRHVPNQTFHVNAVGSYNPLVHGMLRQALKKHGFTSAHKFQSLMTDAVRTTGQMSDLVGEDVLAVTLQPTERRIEVTFNQADTSTQIPMPAGAGGDPDQWADHPRVYTPFALLPGMIFHPAVASVGGWSTNVGNGPPLEYAISGTGLDPAKGGFYYGSHPRKQPPS